MSLETGGVHPLAKELDIQLDTEISPFSYSVRMDIIGDHIVLVLADLYNAEGPERDYIYVVNWKQGLSTLVSHILHTMLPHHPPTTPQGT
jgi:hypothetical protein